jgi:hypothetical protein
MDKTSREQLEEVKPLLLMNKSKEWFRNKLLTLLRPQAIQFIRKIKNPSKFKQILREWVKQNIKV